MEQGHIQLIKKNLHKLKLQTFKDIVTKYLASTRNMNVNVNIHISTELDRVKANVQGSSNEFDIIISGTIELGKLLEAISHEVAHIVLMNNKHTSRFEEEKDKFLKVLVKELNKILNK